MSKNDNGKTQYVLLEVEEGFPILPGSKVAAIGLEREKPIFQLLNDTYIGELGEAPGTVVVFEDSNGEINPKCTVDKIFKLNKVDAVLKRDKEGERGSPE